jgi:hypothetical protein
MKDHDVVEAFVAYLRDHGYSGLQVDRWPDDENRDSPDIDAIAGPFAIEHTSIDTLSHQRRDADWFMQAVGGLEHQLPPLPFRLRIVLQYHAVSKGQHWPEIRQALTSWIICKAPYLADGGHVIDTIPGVPFPLHVEKTSHRSHGVSFGRYEPADDTLPGRLRQQFARKAEKLAPYQGRGTTTVLLVENEDVALMNHLKMLNAIQDAYLGGRPPGVDQIWYADTTFAPDIEFTDFTPKLIGQQQPKECR